MSITLYAQPYNLSASGFYFSNPGEYAQKSKHARDDFGSPVEEYELQFIEGSSLDAAFAEAWGINQCNFPQFLERAEEWYDDQKEVFIIAVGEVGYQFDPDTVDSNDFDIEFYLDISLRGLAAQFVEEGLFGDIPEHLQHYIDYDAIARDLSCDYSETTVAGKKLIYRAS